MLTFTEDESSAACTPKSGLKPPWSAEAFDDLDGRPAPVDRPHPGEPVHPAQGLRARLRLRVETGRLREVETPARRRAARAALTTAS
jgi:hypothetical protein